MSEVISSIAEELAADDADPASAAIFLEKLSELSEEKVELNSADEDEISRLFFLTAFQVKSLADYVRKYGKIVSIFEIAAIPGFDRETVETIIPFATLADKSSGIQVPRSASHTLLSSLIIRPGTKDTSDLGSPARVLTRYKFTAGNFSGGFTGEKDPGEKMFPHNNCIPDFFSASLAYNGTGFIRRIIIGDYSARFGQGTSVNTGIKTGLSLSTPGYLAGRNDIRPYTSTDENNFFRGMAVMMSVRDADISVYYSSNLIDATLSDPSDSTSVTVNSLYKTGYHNTANYFQKNDAVREQCFGMNLTYNFRKFRAGMILSGNRFSIPVKPLKTDPSDLYDFSGDRHANYSVFYSSNMNRIIMFGEASFGNRFEYSFIQGFSLRPADRLNINFFFRSSSPGFISLHGRPPGVSSGTDNEHGIFGNFTFEAAKHLFISGGSDIRIFPWLRYRCSSPSFSCREEIRIRYIPSDRLTFEGIYNYRYSETDSNSDTGIPARLGVISRSFRIHARYSPADNIATGTRFDYKTVSGSGGMGFLMLQDLNIRFRNTPVSLWLRFCVYNTGGFDTGIYTWENDLLNGFSIPVMYGSGSREYCMLSWKPGSYMELRLKYGITGRRNDEGMNDLREIKMQVKLLF